MIGRGFPYRTLVGLLVAGCAFCLAGSSYAATGSGPKNLGTVKQVALGDSSLCVVNASDALVCWGDQSEIPAPSGVLGKIKMIVRSSDGTDRCVIKITNSAQCWGEDDSIKAVPSNLGSVSQVAVGNGYACAVLASNSALRCWGGVDGFDDNGSPTVQPFPVPGDLGAVNNVAAFGSSASDFNPGMCVVTKTNIGKCWDAAGTTLLSVSNVKTVAPGSSFACFINSSDLVVCPGFTDNSGEEPVVGEALVLPKDLGKVSLLSSGPRFACALNLAKAVKCWASTDYDQAGLVTNVPKGLGQSTLVTSLSSGGDAVCAISSVSALLCWGDNSAGKLDGLPVGIIQGRIIKSSAPNSFTTDPASWTWGNQPNIFSQQWQRSLDGGKTWNNITGANQMTYIASNSDKGKLVRLCITASNPNGSGTSCSILSAPRVEVSIKDSLTKADGKLDDQDTASSVTYLWQRWNSANQTWAGIPKATGLSRTPDTADKSAGWIRFCAQGTSLIGVGPVECSDPLGKIVVNSETLESSVGILQSGLKLQFAAGFKINSIYEPDSYDEDIKSFGIGFGEEPYLPTLQPAYQWQRADRTENGAAQKWTSIPGAITASYTPSGLDQGKDLRMCLNFTGAMGSAGPQCFLSYSSPYFLIPPLQPSTPISSGTPFSADLSADWSPEAPITTPTYKWQSALTYSGAWTTVSGATKTSWTAPNSYKGKYIRFCLQASNLLGPAESCSDPYGPPLLDGLPQLVLSGKSLAIDQGTTDEPALNWLIEPASTTYRWSRANSASGPWVVIGGAGGASYLPGSADKGKYLRACLQGTNTWGTGVEACSAARKN